MYISQLLSIYRFDDKLVEVTEDDFKRSEEEVRKLFVDAFKFKGNPDSSFLDPISKSEEMDKQKARVLKNLTKNVLRNKAMTLFENDNP